MRFEGDDIDETSKFTSNIPGGMFRLKKIDEGSMNKFSC